MEKFAPCEQGIKALMLHYRKSFRIPENINHYSEEDYRDAERKYIKLCMTHGKYALSN
ncbi:MAG: hypothetical protein RBT11_13710 [Desulfobacterales bacterium]|jgi:hypothetical protein|nr:hypothetical protein [Desulfobacterales bacterium]